jgi:hypothetical protein
MDRYRCLVQMPSRNIQIAAGILVVVALLVIFKRKTPVGPERAADVIITKAVDAVEAGEIGDMMDLVADDFSGHHEALGTIDKSSLKRYLTQMSYIGDGISITIASQDFTIGPNGRSVSIKLRALIVAGGIRGAFENKAEAREYRVRIELRDDEWLFVSAH